MSAPLHPRDSFELEGMSPLAAAFETAVARGRLHHAWLLTGPEGVGKASFAYRAARRLLGARADAAFGPLGAAPDDPVSRMISARAHPDLIVLERAGEGGVARKSIPVDEARRLPAFFAKAPALGPYRVAIIDAADDLNVNAANAVLKTLEEPSSRGVLLLVSHAPGRLLPTIRSRCRRLAASPWEDAALADFAERTLGLAADQAAVLASMAGGAPGRLASLAAGGALELGAAAGALLQGLPALDRGRVQALADGFRGADGAARFVLVLERLEVAMRRAALSHGGGAAAAWARLSTRTAELAGEVEALNLDRADAFWTLLGEIGSTARAHAPPC